MAGIYRGDRKEFDVARFAKKCDDAGEEAGAE